MTMVCCFAFGCYCHDSYGKCSFFRFPANKTVFKKWENLCRTIDDVFFIYVDPRKYIHLFPCDPFLKRKDRNAKPSDRLCSCHFKDGKKENGASIFAWNKDKRFDFPEVSTKRTRSKRLSVTCAATGCNSAAVVRVRKPPVRPRHIRQRGARLSQWTNKDTPPQSDSDMVNRLRLLKKGQVSRSVINWPQSPSPPEFGSERDKRLLWGRHRPHGAIVCTAPPSGDHNYGATEIQLPWHSPVGKRKRSQSPVLSSKKMRTCMKVEDEAERLKIVEGANALLNLAGITQELSPLKTFIMLSTPSSSISMSVTTEVKQDGPMSKT